VLSHDFKVNVKQRSPTKDGSAISVYVYCIFIVARNFNAAPTNSNLESSYFQGGKFISSSRVLSVPIFYFLSSSLFLWISKPKTKNKKENKKIGTGRTLELVIKFFP